MLTISTPARIEATLALIKAAVWNGVMARSRTRFRRDNNVGWLIGSLARSPRLLLQKCGAEFAEPWRAVDERPENGVAIKNRKCKQLRGSVDSGFEPSADVVEPRDVEPACDLEYQSVGHRYASEEHCSSVQSFRPARKCPKGP